MFLRKLELTSEQIISTFNGCNEFSAMPDVKALVGFRMGVNADTLRPLVKEVDDTKNAILKEYARLDESGNLLIDSGRALFESDAKMAEAVKQIELEVFNDQTREVSLWHFEAGEVMREDAKNPGALWKFVSKILIDSGMGE